MRTDPERAALADATGVYVRAQRPDDRWDSVDMAELDRESLIEFVKSRGPVTDWARDLVLLLLGHSRDGLDYSTAPTDAVRQASCGGTFWYRLDEHGGIHITAPQHFMEYMLSPDRIVPPDDLPVTS
ncbi:hypothetical protein PBI_TEAMOCIL_85 [Microbacterium phage Teamocil]|uniref:Uncharacterized protein n=1 Tax=Microbacterium phage Teamocil TaxID=2656554 RepID=A0A649VZS5_9CAUD|nr:hypothetical protein QDA12_gp85 [Microbacterium phage Teamocil]QGJ88936.1 hypothetical protein PBI_GINA_85 [Microbacterium phage Gina]QGJ97033.1 hypothetical protein PBI_TEAMOCIL_85 [Microbacterium phage Teamocil]